MFYEDPKKRKRNNGQKKIPLLQQYFAQKIHCFGGVALS